MRVIIVIMAIISIIIYYYRLKKGQKCRLVFRGKRSSWQDYHRSICQRKDPLVMVPGLRCWSCPCPGGFSRLVWTRRVFPHLTGIPEGCGEDGVGCQPGTGTANSPLLLVHGSAARCITSFHIASAEEVRFLLSIRIGFLTD